jgi:hypothetical protein
MARPCLRSLPLKKPLVPITRKRGMPENLWDEEAPRYAAGAIEVLITLLSDECSA